MIIDGSILLAIKESVLREKLQMLKEYENALKQQKLSKNKTSRHSTCA